MSDGAGESGRECANHSQNKRIKYGCDDFGRAVARISVAQICESEGYQSFQHSALETLSNVAVRYIENLGKSAKSHANLAGRTGCNIFDIVQSLEDFGADCGFPGASDIDKCLASSGTVKELIQYVDESEEIPFACDLPQFPIVKDRKLATSFAQVDEEPPGCHIPSWLPSFPKPLMFLSPSDKVGNGDNLEQTNKVENPGKHKEEHWLLRLHQGMSHKRLEVPSTDTLDSSKTNPFLASPLKYGEVEVSPVVFPGKPMHDPSTEKIIVENHVRKENKVLGIEINENASNKHQNHLYAAEDDKANAQASERTVVKFSIKVNRKYLLTSKDDSDNENCVTDTIAQSERIESDIKKEEKKRMAEDNLKKPVDSPEELTQL